MYTKYMRPCLDASACLTWLIFASQASSSFIHPTNLKGLFSIDYDFTTFPQKLA